MHCSEFVLYNDPGGDLEREKKGKGRNVHRMSAHTHPLKGFRAITHSLHFGV